MRIHPMDVDGEPTPAEPRAEPCPDARSRRRFVRAMTWAGGVSTLFYVSILWDFRWFPLRTAVHSRAFSNMFDLQARALMHGHLSVPRGSLSIEGFIHDGREYTYFPPLPALLRIPILALTDRLDGRLTAPSMLTAWVLTLVLTAALLWRVRAVLRPGAALGRWEAAVYGMVFVTMTAGSVVLFLASQPWAYHEVYAWATATSAGTLFGLVGVLEHPTVRRALTTAAFACATILTRTTQGWALSIAAIGAGVLLTVRRSGHRRVGTVLAVGAAAALVCGAAVNYAKFRHPFMFPLQDQVWTAMSPHRRAALAANGGDLVSPDLFWTTTVNYLRPDGVRFVPIFPFITLPAEAARSYGGGFVDQSYRTGSVTSFMPLLFVATLWAVWVVFVPARWLRRSRPAVGREVLRLPLVGAGAILGGILFYGYLANRYTSEFVPLLYLGTAVGVADITRRLGGWSRRRRRWVAGAVAAVAVYSVAANSAVALTTSRQSNPGMPLRDYVVLQAKVSDVTGHPLDRFVRRSDSLPAKGPADRLQIVGDCEALYVGTGDSYAAWEVVEARDASFEVVPAAPAPPDVTSVTLARFEGWLVRELVVQRRGAELRVVLTGPDGTFPGPWVPAVAGVPVPVLVRVAAHEGIYKVEVAGSLHLFVGMKEWTPDNLSIPSLLRPAVGDQSIASGMVVRPLVTPRLPLCDRLARALGG